MASALPSYLYSHVHPGLEIPMGTALKGTQAGIGLKIDDIKEWNKQFRKEHLHIVDEDPDLVGLLDSEHYARTCSFASSYINQLENLSTEEFESLLCKLNGLILGSNDPIPYRDQMMTIFRLNNFEEIWADSKLFHSYIQQHDPDPNSLKWFDSFLKDEHSQFIEELRESDKEDLIEESEALSDQSKQQLKKYAVLCCRPQELPSKMNQFFQELQSQLKDPKTDPFRLAAFAHMRIVQIHPFKDGNGRLARLFLNMILKKYDFPAIYFYSEAQYSKEVRLALKDTLSFAYFIKQKVDLFQKLQEVAKEAFSSIKKQYDFIRDQGIWTGKWKNILGPCIDQDMRESLGC